jgi:hypothetical protein
MFLTKHTDQVESNQVPPLDTDYMKLIINESKRYCNTLAQSEFDMRPMIDISTELINKIIVKLVYFNYIFNFNSF